MNLHDFILCFASGCTVVFGLLFLVSRRLISRLCQREICLVTFVLTDQGTDVENSRRDRTVRIYMVGHPYESPDEAFLLLQSKYPGRAIKDVSVHPLGQASFPSPFKLRRSCGNPVS